jgi:fructokinase
MRENMLYGSIEAGGTKFRCAVGRDPQSIVGEVRFATRAPEETLEEAAAFFRPFVESGQVGRVGLGSFGPVDLDPESATYGYITSTPKPGWQNTDIHGRLEEKLGVPVVMDTDVNAAALGEYEWGAGRGKDPCLYLTVGTGIGGGLVKDGKPYFGLLTPEMGHVRIPHDLRVDPFPGACPFHGDCLEGLAAGPAIEKRMGKRGELLAEDDPFWEIEAGYLADALMNYIVVASPRIIIVGGGVMKQQAVWRSLRSNLQERLNGYLRHEMLLERMEEYVVPPELGDRAGVMGGIVLAREGDGGRGIRDE